MGIYSIKPAFQRALGGIESFLVRRRVHPDYITLAALAVSILGGLALYASRWEPWLLLLIPAIVLIRTALNALDGLVARDTGLARPWGEVLNECCDRVSDIALFTGVALVTGSNMVLGMAALVAMLLSSYLGTVAKAAGGRRQYGGVMGKADRMMLLGVASVVAFALPSIPVFQFFLVIVIVGLILTIITRLRTTYVDLQSLR